MWGKAEVICS